MLCAKSNHDRQPRLLSRESSQSTLGARRPTGALAINGACTGLVASPTQRAFTVGVSVAEWVEVASILLTDLVGSRRLATSFAPLPTDQLREERYRLVRACQVNGRRGWRCRVNRGSLTPGARPTFPAQTTRAPRCTVGLVQRRERQRLAVVGGTGSDCPHPNVS